MIQSLPKEFFAGNRQSFATAINGGVAVLTAYSKVQLTNDEANTFEQEANFWYLTGIEDADWWLIIDGARDHSWLVRPKRSDQSDLFDGSLSDEKARELSGINEIIDRDLAMTVLRGLARTHGMVYMAGQLPYIDRMEFAPNPAIRDLSEILSRVFKRVQSCRRELAELRAIKQPIEIEQIKRATQLTVKTFKAIREKIETYNYEYELEADFTHAFRWAGATHAYAPIVAGGGNACTLHYAQNDQRLNKNGLVLMDIGARVNGYAADVTRTYSMKTPTKRMIAVHKAVEIAHKQIIAACKPETTIDAYQAVVETSMTEALRSLGLYDEPDDYERYFPHAVSHGLGIDVHDSLGGPEALRVGMVLTVEPGIYIPEENIGIRIEDDILVGENGPINLTKALSTGL